MARYIDADRLKTKIHELYVQPNIELWQVVKLVANSPTADVVPKSEVERLTKELDELAEEHSDLIVEKDQLFDMVVEQRVELDAMRGAANSYKMHYEKAKTEVERWKENFNVLDVECSRLEKYESDFHNEVIKAKAEVAREIFEEIEMHIIENCCVTDDDVDGIWKHIAELKKKYTQDCRDCKYFVGCEQAVWTGPCDDYDGSKAKEERGE